MGGPEGQRNRMAKWTRKAVLAILPILVLLLPTSLLAGDQLSAFRSLQSLFAGAPAPEDPAGRIARQAMLDRASRMAIISLLRVPAAERDPAAFLQMQKEIERIDKDSTEIIRPYIYEGKWLDGRFSSKIVNYIWLLAQHSDDQDLLAEVLRQIEPRVRDGTFDGQEYGLLYDRVALDRGLPQRFGTQFICQEGVSVPANTERPEELEARRAKLGFPTTYEVYRKTMEDMGCN